MRLISAGSLVRAQSGPLSKEGGAQRRSYPLGSSTSDLRFHKIGTQLQPNRHGRRLMYYLDIDALHSALLSITVVSEKVRAAREILSATGDAPARLGKFLCEAENDLRMAQATLGGELGFSLCPRCWPPELVATDLDGKLNCPVCGRISHEQAA